MILAKPLPLLAMILTFCLTPLARCVDRADIDIPKDETPKQAIKRGCKVFDTLDLDAAMKLFAWDDDKQRDFVKSYAEYAIALTRVELTIEKKFSRKDADEMVHAAGEHTETDLEEAEFTLDGDKATATFKGTDNPIILRRIDGTWKLVAADLLKDVGAEEVKSAMSDYNKFTKALVEIAKDVEVGKYTAPEATEVVKQLVNPPAPNPKAGL